MAGRLVDLTVLGASPSRSFSKSATTMEKRPRQHRRSQRRASGDQPAGCLGLCRPAGNPRRRCGGRDLARVFPDLDREALRARLTGPSQFEWVRRGLTPEQKQTVNALGIPGMSLHQRAPPILSARARGRACCRLDRHRRPRHRRLEQTYESPWPMARSSTRSRYPRAAHSAARARCISAGIQRARRGRHRVRRE